MVDKEMATDEASQSSIPEGNAPKDALTNAAADAWLWYFSFVILFFF